MRVIHEQRKHQQHKLRIPYGDIHLAALARQTFSYKIHFMHSLINTRLLQDWWKQERIRLILKQFNDITFRSGCRKSFEGCFSFFQQGLKQCPWLLSRLESFLNLSPMSAQLPCVISSRVSLQVCARNLILAHAVLRELTLAVGPRGTGACCGARDSCRE